MPTIIIDRSRPVDLRKFLHEVYATRFNVARESPKSVALHELDLSKLGQISCFEEGEKQIPASERLARIERKDLIAADAKIVEAIVDNSDVAPDWLKDEGLQLAIDGTVLVDSESKGEAQLVLCFERGRFKVGYSWYVDDFNRPAMHSKRFETPALVILP